MIAKAKKLQFTTSDGASCESLTEAKVRELTILAKGEFSELKVAEALSNLVDNPREAIAILRLGLPRKPRTPKPAKKSAKRAAVVNAVTQDMKQ